MDWSQAVNLNVVTVIRFGVLPAWKAQEGAEIISHLAQGGFPVD